MKEKLKNFFDKLNKMTLVEVKTSVGSVFTGFILVSAFAFIVGLVVFGWWLTPVEWTPPETPSQMNGVEYQSKIKYVYLLSEWYAYSENSGKLAWFINELDDIDAVACYAASQSTDIAEQARLINIAYTRNGYGCN